MARNDAGFAKPKEDFSKELKYPITSLNHNLWEKFPEWLIKTDAPNALEEALKALNDVNDWHNQIIKDVVELHEFLEKERQESDGEIPVRACYVCQQKQIELILGLDIETAKQFLDEMGPTEKET